LEEGSRRTFESLAFLLMPAEAGREGALVEADERWRLDLSRVPVQADVVVWGRMPLPSGTPVGEAMRAAMARELALRSIRYRLPRRLRIVALHRLTPPLFRLSRARNRARRALLGGALAELATSEAVPRILDAVAEAAGAAGRVRVLERGSGGAGLSRITLPGEREALLRVARAGDPGDPQWAADALERLASAGVQHVPRLFGRGETAGASWSAETALAGRRPLRVSPGLASEVVRVSLRFPRAEGAPTALAADLDASAAALPDHAPALRQVLAGLEDTAASLPGVMRHGDLWAGNLLVERGALSGLVDWDGWHPSAVPATDILRLFATEERIRRRAALGSMWLERPWSDEAFLALAHEYWHAFGVKPEPHVLELVGVAWWASEVAGTLSRLPHRARDERWIALNVEPVLARLAG
jgi:hypothetical protein